MKKRNTMKKILILSCNTGEGHNSAARAIKTHLTACNVECDIIDTLSLVGNTISQSVSDLYLYSTKTNLFKYMYRIGGAVSDSIKTKSIIYAWNWMYAERLREYIEENGYDCVICVHLFPAEAMTALKSSGKTDIPAIFVMTDYTCIPFLDETELDCYIIPHEHLIEEFAGCGIPREKLCPYGIPVDKDFLHSTDKSSARKTVSETFGWEMHGNKWFLIMTGSMGFGNTQELIDEIARQSDGDIETIVICGRNEEMLTMLQQKNADNPSIHPVGYTDRIPVLMDACDVLFTKPGGISSTEAMHKHIPLIHTAPIPGCETRNAEFFHYHGMSYSSTDPAQQARTAIRLCNDHTYRNKMTCAQTTNAVPDTCQKIMQLLKGLHKNARTETVKMPLRSAML